MIEIFLCNAIVFEKFSCVDHKFVVYYCKWIICQMFYLNIIKSCAFVFLEKNITVFLLVILLFDTIKTCNYQYIKSNKILKY